MYSFPDIEWSAAAARLWDRDGLYLHRGEHS